MSEQFVRAMYDSVPDDDLRRVSAEHLNAAAESTWQLGEQTAPADVKVRVHNPDDWAPDRTVIEIVSPDMPFIVDSVSSLLETFDIVVELMTHPVVDRRSYVHLQIEKIGTDVGLAELTREIETVMHDVSFAVRDWRAMRERATALAIELDDWAREAAAGRARFESSIGTGASEAAALLRWMEAGSFTFIGYREYDLVEGNGGGPARLVARVETGLGVLADAGPSERVLESPPQLAALAARPRVLNLTKANAVSTVHRTVPLDYVGVKEIDADGKVTGERRFVGLYTSSVYSGSVHDVPVVRAKIAEVVRRWDPAAGSHDRSRLMHVMQTYPRDELFQIDVDELDRLVKAVFDVRDRRRVSVVLRNDDYGRFLSFLIFVPRDRYTTQVRLEMQRLLGQAYDGEQLRFSTEISDQALARIHVVLYRDPTLPHDDPTHDEIEDLLTTAIVTWEDGLREALTERLGVDDGLATFRRFASAFPTAYRANTEPADAVTDLERLDVLGGADGSSFDAHLESGASGEAVRCRVYHADGPITLTKLIPILHDVGAVVEHERPYEIVTDGGPSGFVYDLSLRFGADLDGDDEERLRATLVAVWNGEAESDRLGHLVIDAGLTWREVAVVRAYARYLVQLGGGFSIAYTLELLAQHPQIVAALVDLFAARLDPDGPEPSPVQAVQAQQDDDAEPQLTESQELHDEIVTAIDGVAGLDADRILRSMLSVIEATVRTNAWVRHASSGKSGIRPALAFKIDAARVDIMPKPVPHAEIFVSSPSVEGVHLRAGRVARGGLRWSDRYEDFRTEVLGLMKAQSVKNSVIVPVGAKGGFVARRLPPDAERSVVMDEVVECYRSFIGALLDVTDNTVTPDAAGEAFVVPPKTVRRLDGDDPYLVVAADKGTATFSDIANAIAVDRDFWLGDAFASGGSVGYDHKALAITARGAWVSVVRHFEQLDLDVSSQPFTVVGVGDMSGDVFGNGMLRSRAIRLVAAFDHRHIFIDPDPDPERSFEERQRLFDLPRSSWADYDEALLSPGGGVHSRTAKSIDLPPEALEALGLEADAGAFTPNELISMILRAPVDLIWNGGIGTYVKASTESNVSVGDRANDGLRVNGRDLRCRVLAEGGNLGVTQLGRIEYARHGGPGGAGGHINTDAIDNSAGVDCSDHEVNLKILLGTAMAGGQVDPADRDDLLASMADDVCDLVLVNNDAQNETLTLAESIAPGMTDVHQRLLGWLGERGGLDRGLEYLPSDAELHDRAASGEGLTRPELAVLLAYVKNTLTDDLLASDLVDEPEFATLLHAYFPAAVGDACSSLIEAHPLRRELVATLVSNQLVNLGGVSMVHRLIEETSATVADVARAHRVALEVFDLHGRMEEIRALDGIVPAETQTTLKLEIKRLGERATRWFLRHERQPIDVSGVVAAYRRPVSELFVMLRRSRDEQMAALAHQLDDEATTGGLDDDVAELDIAFGFLDLTDVATRTGASIEIVATVSTVVEARLGLGWLRHHIVALPRDDHWMTLARGALRDEFYREHAELTATIVAWGHEPSDAETVVSEWIDGHETSVRRFEATIDEIKSAGRLDLAGMSVAVRALSSLCRA